jgi:hypothetical protein
MLTLNNTYIIACETLKGELTKSMEEEDCKWPVLWIDSGKHAWPDKLRSAVQEAVDGISRDNSTILLMFGFCGNAMVGVKSGAHTLVLPRAADCIPLFLGSRRRREECGGDSYFFTGGYIDSGSSIAEDTGKVFERYGEKRGLSILRRLLKNYRNFMIIDTGVFDVEKVREKVERFAGLVDIPVSVIPGDLRLIRALAAGNWNADEFLIVPPDKVITLEDSMGAGKPQGAGEN